jgi:hypothetical protein
MPAARKLTLLPLREKVAREAGRMRGLSTPSDLASQLSQPAPRDPSSVGFADTFSRKGRRTSGSSL